MSDYRYENPPSEAYTGAREQRESMTRKRAWTLVAGIGAGVGLAFMTYGAAEKGNQRNDPTPAGAETGEPYCEFSEETTAAEINHGDGKQSIILQIAGVDLGTCFNSAEAYIEGLNGRPIDSPRWDDEILIPVSAQFHPGD